MRLPTLALALAFVSIPVAVAAAQGPPPNLLHFQARLADAGGNAIQGPVSVQVRIYDAPSGGAVLFSESHAATALNGVVNLVLGSVSSLPTTLFDGTDRYVALQIGADPEMSPRRSIVAVPYAARAALATLASGLASGGTLPVGLITSAHILDGTIVAADLAASSVTSTQLASGAVTNAKLATGAVTLAKLASDSVDDSKIVDGTITFKDIAAGGVTLASLAANSVDGSKIVNGSIAAADLAAGAVTSSALASNSVTGAKIVDGTITAADLAPGIIGTASLGPNSVNSSHIVDGAIAAADLAHPIAAASPTSPDDAVLSVLANAPAQRAIRGEVANVGFPSSAAGVTGVADNVGTGVVGLGGSMGVYGEIVGGGGTADAGVKGIATLLSSGATLTGVWGEITQAISPNARGVYAKGPTGVFAEGTGAGSAAVRGMNTSTIGQAYGVNGSSASTTGVGVEGQALSTTGQTHGVFGVSSSPTGFGMRGWNLSNTGAGAHGVVGRCDSPTAFGILSQGSTGAAGQKSFLQPHPTDPSREIRFVCLEGNESGTYFRGSAQLVGGVAVILVPEEFRLASEAASLTVQLTASGERAALWTEKEDTQQIVVRGDRDVKFHYLVNGVRRGFAEYQPFHPNGTFVPDYRGLPFGSQYPDAMRRILVENGTLNADFTPNEQTAAKLGWELRDASEHPRNRAASAVGGAR